MGLLKVIFRKEHLQPDIFVQAGLRFFQWVDQSIFSRELMPSLANWQRNRWERIVAQESFRLLRPLHTVPRLKLALVASRDHRFVRRNTAVERLGSRWGPACTRISSGSRSHLSRKNRVGIPVLASLPVKVTRCRIRDRTLTTTSSPGNTWDRPRARSRTGGRACRACRPYVPGRSSNSFRRADWRAMKSNSRDGKASLDRVECSGPPTMLSAASPSPSSSRSALQMA